MLLPFDHSFVSELQQEGILRYESRCQKCDIALRTICLKTFGGRSKYDAQFGAGFGHAQHIRAGAAPAAFSLIPPR